MNNQMERAQYLQSLHIPGKPLILFNCWDAGSAKVIQEAGAKAIATASWSVAASHGFEDGEKVPFELVVENLKRIVSVVEVPVTIDLEGGYARDLPGLQANIAKVLEAGAVGINLEDQIVGGEGLYSIEEQCSRIRAVREQAAKLGIPLVINARTDVFLKAGSDISRHHVEEAMSRCLAYSEAGASSFFAPGLWEANHIEAVCQHSTLPVNIMMTAQSPAKKKMAALGVGRISYGPGPYRQVMQSLKHASSQAFSSE